MQTLMLYDFKICEEKIAGSFEMENSYIMATSRTFYYILQIHEYINKNNNKVY